MFHWATRRIGVIDAIVSSDLFSVAFGNREAGAATYETLTGGVLRKADVWETIEWRKSQGLEQSKARP